MAKSTILRVKRRLEDSPQDAFVITCKRLKTTEVSPSLFVFRGTVEQENIVVKNLVPKEEPKLKAETNVKDIIDKIRKERKDASNKHRYEIVRTCRGLEEEKEYDFVDLVRKEGAESDAKYAYDLYVSTKHDFDISMLDDLVSIENYETDLVPGSYRDNGRQSPSSEGESSDDSNDENNWRNDYPDEENSSIGEDDMMQAMERLDMEDLSSDAGEEKIYEEDSTYKDDVLRYGVAYAKYKSKVLNNETKVGDSILLHCSKNDEGYNYESDDGFYYGQEEDTEQFKQQYRNDSDDDLN